MSQSVESFQRTESTPSPCCNVNSPINRDTQPEALLIRGSAQLPSKSSHQLIPRKFEKTSQSWRERVCVCIAKTKEKGRRNEERWWGEEEPQNQKRREKQADEGYACTTLEIDAYPSLSHPNSNTAAKGHSCAQVRFICFPEGSGLRFFPHSLLAILQARWCWCCRGFRWQGVHP